MLTYVHNMFQHLNSENWISISDYRSCKYTFIYHDTIHIFILYFNILILNFTKQFSIEYEYKTRWHIPVPKPLMGAYRVILNFRKQYLFTYSTALSHNCQDVVRKSTQNAIFNLVINLNTFKKKIIEFSWYVRIWYHFYSAI